jgi:hypothetical protein
MEQEIKKNRIEKSNLTLDDKNTVSNLTTTQENAESQSTKATKRNKKPEMVRYQPPSSRANKASQSLVNTTTEFKANDVIEINFLELTLNLVY